jgi:integrase
MAHVLDRRWRRNSTTGEREATGYDGPSPWLARWRDPDGAQRSKGFARRADAEQHLVAVQHRIMAGEYVDPNAGKVTVREWCERWRSMQVHRPSTAAQVEGYFRLHLYPTLGDRQLRSVLPSDVQAWVAGRSKTLAPGSVELVYRHFAAAMKAAEGDRVIARSPCQSISLPKKVRAEVVPPTVEQVEAIADAVQDRYRAAVVVAAGAGLRLGEVFGLQVDRVDFIRRSIRVDQQLLTPGNGPAVLGPPKTASSVRSVPIADVVVHELAEHLRRFPPVDGFVFTTELDRPVRRSTFQCAWARGVKAASTPGVRFHDLRHHYASALIAAGCSVKAVQAALGHASATETLETYAHLWPADEDRTRDAIQALWAGADVREMCAVADSDGAVEG